MAERTWWMAAAEALRPWRSAAGAAALVLIGGQLLWRAVILGRGYFTQDDFLMLTLGARPLSLDLLVQDYSGHLFPGGFLFAWANTHLAPLDWTLAVVEIVVLQLVASALAWLVLCRLLPGSWWRLACCRSTCSARWRCGPPSGGRWRSSTSRSASSCSSRPGPCCIGCRRTAAGPAPWSCWRPRRGSCSRSAPCCTRWCSASWPWRSPRRSACAGSSWRCGATSSYGCPSLR